MMTITESTWFRSEFVSIWRGPDLELVVCQHPRTEAWRWTCVGCRTPDDSDNADKSGWVWAVSRESAEQAAIRFYVEKD